MKFFPPLFVLACATTTIATASASPTVTPLADAPIIAPLGETPPPTAAAVTAPTLAPPEAISRRTLALYALVVCSLLGAMVIAILLIGRRGRRETALLTEPARHPALDPRFGRTPTQPSLPRIELPAEQPPTKPTFLS